MKKIQSDKLDFIVTMLINKYFLIAVLILSFFCFKNDFLKPEEFWYMYNASENNCIPSIFDGTKISPHDVLETYSSCRVLDLSYDREWIILDCDEHDFKGALFFSKTKEVCKNFSEYVNPPIPKII